MISSFDLDRWFRALDVATVNWEIRARVVQKAHIRVFGNGKRFSMHLEDVSGKIRAVAFNEACDYFYGRLEFNKVYSISNARLQYSDKDAFGRNIWSNLPNDFEIHLKMDSTIVEIEDSNEIPRAQFNFVSFSDIRAKQKDDIVDVIGFCEDEVSEDEFESLEGRELTKLVISLVNETGSQINVTLWNNLAKTFDGQQKVIAIKNGRIDEFEGNKGVSVSLDSSFIIDPDVPQASHLRR